MTTLIGPHEKHRRAFAQNSGFEATPNSFWLSDFATTAQRISVPPERSMVTSPCSRSLFPVVSLAADW
jgi:hypothetical protein